MADAVQEINLESIGGLSLNQTGPLLLVPTAGGLAILSPKQVNFGGSLFAFFIVCMATSFMLVLFFINVVVLRFVLVLAFNAQTPAASGPEASSGSPYSDRSSESDSDDWFLGWLTSSDTDSSSLFDISESVFDDDKSRMFWKSDSIGGPLK